MKRLLLLVVASILACPSAALAEEWVNLQRLDLPGGSYLSRLDRNSLVRKGDIVWYWNSTVFLNEKTPNEPYDFRNYISADCSSPVVRDRKTVNFDRRGFVTHSNNDGDRGRLRNVFSFEGMFNRPAFCYVCGGRRYSKLCSLYGL